MLWCVSDRQQIDGLRFLILYTFIGELKSLVFKVIIAMLVLIAVIVFLPYNIMFQVVLCILIIYYCISFHRLSDLFIPLLCLKFSLVFYLALFCFIQIFMLCIQQKFVFPFQLWWIILEFIVVQVSHHSLLCCTKVYT